MVVMVYPYNRTTIIIITMISNNDVFPWEHRYHYCPINIIGSLKITVDFIVAWIAGCCSSMLMPPIRMPMPTKPLDSMLVDALAVGGQLSFDISVICLKRSPSASTSRHLPRIHISHRIFDQTVPKQHQAPRQTQ